MRDIERVVDFFDEKLKFSAKAEFSAGLQRVEIKIKNSGKNIKGACFLPINQVEILVSKNVYSRCVLLAQKIMLFKKIEKSNSHLYPKACFHELLWHSLDVSTKRLASDILLFTNQYDKDIWECKSLSPSGENM